MTAFNLYPNLRDDFAAALPVFPRPGPPQRAVRLVLVPPLRDVAPVQAEVGRKPAATVRQDAARDPFEIHRIELGEVTPLGALTIKLSSDHIYC